MRRPGPAGMALLLAFSLVAAIEFRTVLEMLGFSVTSQVYYPGAGLLLLLGFGLLIAFSEAKEGNGSKPGTHTQQ